MTEHNNITLVNVATVLFFLAIIWIAYDVFIHNRPRYNPEAFTNEITVASGTQQSNVPDELLAQNASPEIITEMARQLQTLDAADRHLARDQISHYVMHPDIVRKYRETTETMLENLKKQVDAHSQEKRKRLDRLNTYLLNLQEFVDADFLDRQRKLKITAIKSHNNGQELSLIPVSSSINKGQLRSGQYRVRVNGGCMQVAENNNYEVTPLDMNNKSQIFQLEMIFNETNYRNAMSKGYPQISDLGQVRYPFALLRAASNGNCLRNHHGRLSVEPCREHKGQRWAVLEESSLPKCM